MPPNQQPKSLPQRRPEAGAIRFADLVGHFDVIRVTCSKCDRKGRYSLAQLIEHHTAEAGLPDWKTRLTADCPRRAKPGNIWDLCGAHFPDLEAVLYLP